MTAVGPWGQVSGEGADCFDALTGIRDHPGHVPAPFTSERLCSPGSRTVP
ncbi:hypothetical protein [Streptomyces sp. NPDC005303]